MKQVTLEYSGKHALVSSLRHIEGKQKGHERLQVRHSLTRIRQIAEFRLTFCLEAVRETPGRHKNTGFRQVNLQTELRKMNCLMKAMILSLGLHCTVLFLVFALSSSLAQQDKPIVIDFNYVEPSDPSTPQTARPQKKANTSAIAKAIPLLSAPKQKSAPPKPASKPARPVPVIAKPGESVPEAPEQSSSATATTMNGGSGSTGSSHTGGNGGSGTPGSKQAGGSSGTGDSGEKLASKYRAEHFAYIKHIIEQNVSYPQRAQRMGWTGRVVVSFDVAKDGHVVNIRIVKSTGYALLDSNLVNTIRKVEPFPSPPISVHLIIPFTYELR